METLGWKSQQLYEGCLIASLAHAIMVAKYSELSYEHSWDGINYNVQDGAGGRGTLTFTEGVCVGAFRVNSLSDQSLDVKAVLAHAPSGIQQLVFDETLQYLLEEVSGKVVPVVTTIFWAEQSGNIVSPHGLPLVMRAGGYLLQRHLMNTPHAFEAWRNNYEMSDDEFDLMVSLYRARVAHPNLPITLSSQELSILGNDNEGLAESRESFAELNIYWES